jgi:hypothetical protein
LLGTEVENFRRDIHTHHIAKIIGAQTHYSLVGSRYSSVGAQARRRRALRSTTSASGPSPSGSGSGIRAGSARWLNPSYCNGQFVGNVEVTGDLILTGADVAEQFDVSARRDGDHDLPAGTVAVLDGEGALTPCTKAYDKCGRGGFGCW